MFFFVLFFFCFFFAFFFLLFFSGVSIYMYRLCKETSHVDLRVLGFHYTLRLRKQKLVFMVSQIIIILSCCITGTYIHTMSLSCGCLSYYVSTVYFKSSHTSTQSCRC